MNPKFNYDYKVIEYSLNKSIPKLAEFQKPIEIWKKARGNDLMPQWKDFSFEDWVGWHSSMCVTEILPDSFLQVEKIMGQYYGSQFGKLSQPKIHQSVFDKTALEENHGSTYVKYTKRQYNKGFISLFSGILPKEGATLNKLKILDLPLTNEAEERTVRILSFLTIS